MNDKQKMFLIFHGRFPSEKAAALFAGKSCEAFSEVGHSVTLLVPRRFGRVRKDAHEYYGLSDNFRVVYLPTVDLFPVPFAKAVAFRVSFLIFSLFAVVYLLLKAGRNDVIYSNESLSILLASYVFRRTVYEVHDLPEKNYWFYHKVFEKVALILVHNEWKLEHMREQFLSVREKSFYEPNAVDLKEFDIELSKEGARRRLDLPLDKKIVVYTGHLYSWKGVDTLAEAGRGIGEGIQIYFVGGTEKDVEQFRARYGDIRSIRIVGHRSHHEIPVWQKAADVLVIPNTAKEDISKYYTSPMKLYEYMASRRPIVASRIPSIEEIVSDDDVYFAEPDDQGSLRGTIISVLEDSETERKVISAYKNVSSHTWRLRAERITNEIEKFIIKP